MFKERTQIPVLYNGIKSGFKAAMQNAQEGDFVERPKSLSRYGKLRSQFVSDARANNRAIKEQLDTDSEELTKIYRIDSLTAQDLILRSWDTQARLEEQGVFFGDRAFNFSLDRLEISKAEENQTVQISENAFAALRAMSQADIRAMYPTIPLNAVEQSFEELKLAPNAARVDIILTDSGPKIIEINAQWVDAIAALSGFLFVYGQNAASKKVIKAFGDSFDSRTVALVNINQTKGSRAKGASLELEYLAQKLVSNGKIQECEVIDPYKYRIEYLSRFGGFFVNCDPKYFALEYPDWVDVVRNKVLRNRQALFPAWRPMLDKKIILSLLSSKSEFDDIFTQNGIDTNMLSTSIVPTSALAGFSPDFNSDYVVKGDGYSLNSVFSTLDSNFNQLLGYAKEDEVAYVYQPFVEGRRTNAWVFDTGEQKVKFIENAYTKINVWVLNGSVVGMLVTLSDSPYISDKGYNAPPLVKGDING